MEGGFNKGGGGAEASCPQLLDLIPKEREWMVRDGGSGGGGGGGGRGNGYGGVAEEKQLELKLWPPGQEESSILSLGLFSKSSKSNTNPSAGAKRVFLDTLQSYSEEYQQRQKSGFLHFQHTAALGKESSPKTDGMKAEQQRQQLSHEKKASPATPAAVGNAAVAHNNSHSRTTTAPVVGWPPIRSFRKNIASSSSKPSPAPKTAVPEAPKKTEKCTKGMFVKINMDGIPIGRKVDLKAHDSYENLSSAVDELFKGLLAAQREPVAAGTHNKSSEESPVITGLLDGSGEYTLVYEDNEGDRMLVGDVPWNMFVSTVKRLRVLKTSELSAFIPGSN